MEPRGVNAGGSQHYTYTVAVAGSVGDGTVLVAQALVLDGTSNLVRVTAATEARAVVPLTLTITATPDPVAAGALVCYELRVSNVGSATVANVVLTEVALNVARADRTTITGGGDCNTGTGYCNPGVIITWPPVTLAPGQTETVSFIALVSGPSGTFLHHVATVTFPGGTLSKGLDVVVDQ